MLVAGGVGATLDVTRRGLDLRELGRRRCWEGWRGVCGVIMESWEGWREGGVCRSPVRLMRRLPLDLRWRALCLVGVGIVDGLRRLLSVCGSIQLFFLLFDEGALTRPMTFCLCHVCSSRELFAFGRSFPSDPD